jgi:hypothetical protein
MSTDAIQWRTTAPANFLKQDTPLFDPEKNKTKSVAKGGNSGPQHQGAFEPSQQTRNSTRQFTDIPRDAIHNPFYRIQIPQGAIPFRYQDTNVRGLIAAAQTNNMPAFTWFANQLQTYPWGTQPDLNGVFQNSQRTFFGSEHGGRYYNTLWGYTRQASLYNQPLMQDILLRIGAARPDI